MSAGFHWRTYKKIQPYQLHQIGLKDWRLVRANMPPQKIQILPTTVITGFVIILHFYLPKQQWQSVVITKDTLSEKAYRNLGVSLKISGAS
ncbi:MAG: hypothetical protein KAU26_10525 [Methylococcales bacterium]|nr:hypothetical protein [Methylococcales bacterium]